MDNKNKIEVIDLFLKDRYETGTSNVSCPICKTKLELICNDSAYIVRCQTPNCLIEVFRGI